MYLLLFVQLPWQIAAIKFRIYYYTILYYIINYYTAQCVRAQSHHLPRINLWALLTLHVGVRYSFPVMSRQHIIREWIHQERFWCQTYFYFVTLMLLLWQIIVCNNVFDLIHSCLTEIKVTYGGHWGWQWPIFPLALLGSWPHRKSYGHCRCQMV